MGRRGEYRWHLLVALLVAVSSCADQPASGSPDSGTGDTDSDTDTDTDTDADTDADGDTDTHTDADTDTSPGGNCDEYPPADNGFLVGDVIRNYDLWDKDDDYHQMCEFGGAPQLLFLVITSIT